MSDIEKEPIRTTEPAVDIGVSTSVTDISKFQKLLSFLSERKNDPNVLGKELLKKALEYDPEQLERDAIKVRRKLDVIVIPMVCPPYVTLNATNTESLRIDDDYLYVELLRQTNVCLCTNKMISSTCP